MKWLLIFIPFLISIQSLHKPTSVTIYGLKKKADGIGRHSIELNTLFSSKGIKVAHAGSEKRSLKTRLNRISKFSSENNILFSTDCLTAGHFYKLKKLRKLHNLMISLTMFESSRIPKAYVENLNNFFDIAIVPDNFLLEVYQSSGVEIPIFVNPLVIDLSPFLNANLYEKKTDTFVFGCFGSITRRKGQDLLLKAFAETYGNNTQFKLILSGRYAEPKFFQELHEYISCHHLNNVELKECSFSDEDYLKNFQKIDCYVSLSRGEGFSIQPREAMALGIPCIVTNNTGQTTICNSNLVLSVPSTNEIPCVYDSFQGENLGVQYDPSLQDCKIALRTMVQQHNYYVGLASDARSWASKYDLFSDFSSLYISFFKPEAIHLSEKNYIENNQIFTNSSKLYEKFKTLNY